MRNILVIEGRQSIGGGQIITKKVCDGLSEENNISVFIPGKENAISLYLSDFSQYHYKLKEYSRGKKQVKDYFLFLYNTCSVFKSLYRIVKDNSFDIIYVQHLNVLPVIVLVNIIFKKDVIVHLHVVYADTIVHWLVNLLLRSSYIKKIIGVSNYALQQLDEKNKTKSMVLYNPVCFLNKLNFCDKYQIAIIGDVIYNKGHHILLEALSKTSIQYTLHVIGNIVDYQYHNELQSKYGTVNSIYTGMIHNVTEYLSKNKIGMVVIPSVTSETFSLSMVEAWSIGIPTIATNNFGMKELVDTFLPEYASYLLFKLGSANDLCAKMKELLGDDKLYHELSNRLYSVVKDSFSDKNYMESLCKIIRDI